MAYDENKLAKVKALKEMASRVHTRLIALESADAPIKAVTLSGNTLKFYTTTDTTKTAASTFDLPAEQFLDTLGTKLEPKFAFSAEKYAGATNPNLDGKAVLVLAVKTKSNDGQTETTNYSFLDVSKLVDIYTASDTSIAIADNKIKTQISTETNNAITLKNDGLHVDISGKVDKLTTATAGNVVIFGTGGSVSDSGLAVATDAEVTEMLNEVLGSAS